MGTVQRVSNVASNGDGDDNNEKDRKKLNEAERQRGGWDGTEQGQDGNEGDGKELNKAEQ